jgi:hypothetical protein
LHPAGKIERRRRADPGTIPAKSSRQEEMIMMIPAAVAVPLSTSSLMLGPGIGILGLLGLVSVALGFGVLIARLVTDCPPDGAPRDSYSPDASPRRRNLALLREAA